MPEMTMVGSSWRFLQCKLGGVCTPLTHPSMATRLQSYLASPGPTTLLLTVLTMAVSAALLYFRPSPRGVFQKVKSVLRTSPRPEQAGEQQAAEVGGVKVPHLGVPVYPPEVYQAPAPAAATGDPASD